MNDGPLREGRAGGMPSDVLPPPLTLVELQARIRAVEPGATLVAPRLLRRVIRQHRHLPTLRWNVPHRRSYTLDRDALLEIVDAEELDLAHAARLPERVTLLERPGLDVLEYGDAEETLLRCWRLLFHSRIHAALDERIAEGRLERADIWPRIHRLGCVAFDEIRNVLAQEALLFPDHDDRDAYVEFAAVYLELAYFAPSLLPRCFPGLTDAAAVRALLDEDVDAEEVFRRSQPRGAPRPIDRFEGSEVDQLALPPESQEFEFGAAARPPSEPTYRRLMLKAEEVERHGNVVRAALLAVRAERCAPRKLAGKARATARRALGRLIHRLQQALEAPTPDPQPWEEALWALLRQTPRGIWTAEARLLYDLQKVCVDAEREVSTVDVVEWALTLGKRPIRRPLPSQRDVLMAKHLESAAQRLSAVRLPEQLRRQLTALVRAERERAEERIRAHFRPQINQALDEVGLAPANLPERVSRRKLVEELLDRVTERSHLTLGDMRDALSRSQLKLPDVAGPGELWRGDQLLQADRRLAAALDGVYRRGEFYLRWMQRLSSLAFGTPLGRYFTLFLAVPFGGAFVLLAGIEHFAEPLARHLTAAPHPNLGLKHPLSVLFWGLFILGLIHHAGFRRGVWRVTKTGFHAARVALIDAPRWLLRSELVRQVLRSRLVALGTRFALKPALATVVLWLIGVPGARSPGGLAVWFLATAAAINSRAGRNVEEMCVDALARLWHRVGLRIITGLFYLIVDVFKALLERTEQLLYTVDEWLRFRSGEGRTVYVTKAVLGAVWFYVTYLVRFVVTLLVEPQINPIKHFPVVTVSHKLLFPLIPHFAGVLSYTVERGLAITLATLIIWCIPGIFGFLVWELKENWRLYAANRSPTLRPTVIGRHGETMLRLLRPGFHSGSIPKAYAKLRRAERRARRNGNWHPVRRHLRCLQHLELDLRRFVERDFLALLDECPAWGVPTPTLARLELTTNRIQIALECPPVDAAAMEIAFEYKSGWMLTDTPEPGWSVRLADAQRRVFAVALNGLYKLAAVELLRPTIEAQFPSPMPPYDVVADRLVVWSDANLTRLASYPLRTPGPLRPSLASGSGADRFPILDRRQTLFAETAILWADWVVDVDAACQGRGAVD